MLKAILAGLAAARWRAAARRGWEMGTRVWGDGGEQEPQGINATIGPQSSHPPADEPMAWGAHPYPSRSGELTSAISVRKTWNRALLVGVGSS